jgi:hypothetical protein
MVELRVGVNFVSACQLSILLLSFKALWASLLGGITIPLMNSEDGMFNCSDIVTCAFV